MRDPKTIKLTGAILDAAKREGLLPAVSEEPPKVWARIDAKGRLEYINWALAEQIAAKHYPGTTDMSVVMAVIAVAVRDYMLVEK